MSGGWVLIWRVSQWPDPVPCAILHNQLILISIEWVWHNGARIERTLFDENVAEARVYDWACSRWSEDDDHAHCIVCGYAIGTENEPYYKFRGASLCEYCFDTVVGVSP